MAIRVAYCMPHAPPGPAGTAEGDFTHPHLGVVMMVASPEDDKHRGQFLVFIESESDGAVVRTAKWVHADQLRRTA